MMDYDDELCPACFSYHRIMTEERRQECRLWRKEAMLLEKELELKRKEKELEKIRASYESSLSSHSRVSYSGDSGACSLPIIDLLRDAVYHQSSKEFHILLQEITDELHKYLTGAETEYPDLDEFKFLLLELKKAILSRQNHPEALWPFPNAVNTDSTFNDIAHFTLNQRSDSANSLDTIKEVSQFPSDKRSDSNSLKTYNDVSLHSESTFKLIEDCTPDDDSISLANSLPVDGSRCSFYDQAVVSSSPRSCSDVENSKHELSLVNNQSAADGNITPVNTPNKVRRNSYTLESPSPSVIAYLRNLALEGSKEKSQRISLSEQEERNSARSVVRNLNNIWDKENASKKYMDDVSPDFRDSLEDVDDDRRQLIDDNQNVSCSNGTINANGLLASYHEHQLNQSLHENEKLLRRTKAAIVIQSYARGFFVRRLMRTYKVEQIKNTIKDAVICAWGLYGEQAVTPSDLHLHERIIQQVTAACYELHSIFFKWSTSEKLALIRSDREKLKNPKPKFRRSREGSESESLSLSARSSRSASQNRSETKLPSHKRTRSNEVEVKRPSTLPSTPRTLSLNYKPWR